MSYIYADLRGRIVPFSSSFTLTPEHNGAIFRHDGSSNVTVTVPNTLDDGFNVGFAMFNTGTITVAAGAGATNRSGKTALSTQYQCGSMLVMKRVQVDAVQATIEFLVGGDFA